MGFCGEASFFRLRAVRGAYPGNTNFKTGLYRAKVRAIGRPVCACIGGGGVSRILFTTVFRPFGGHGEGDSVGAELFHAQVTRAQGLFSFRQVIRCWALDYLAENIGASSVVLHYPSKRELIKELESGSYDYVGINFVVATFHKLEELVGIVRRYAPAAKVILGGYGTVLPDELLQPLADYICREEGVGFMRRLLREPEDRPIRHPYAPIPSIKMYSLRRRNVIGHLTAGLGCPNGCDFCCTSHFFKRLYVPFLKSGREIYQALADMQDRAIQAGDKMDTFIMIDEDFFLQARRAREFLECVRRGGRTFSLMGFGSVRGLSQFTADEIAEMGFDTVWTAFEGVSSGYGKLQGKPLPELHAELKKRGVGLLTSMIIGFPYQNREAVLSEFEDLLSLAPVMSQILIYFAFPNTPLYRQVLQEDRYLPHYRTNPDYRRFDGFAMHFKHPHFEPAELEKLQRDLYRREFERLGPSLVRMIGLWLEAHRNLHASPNALLRMRAQRMLRNAVQAAPLLAPAMLFGPTSDVRRTARDLYRALARECGGFGVKTHLQGAAAIGMAVCTGLLQKLNVAQQPTLQRAVYRGDESAVIDPIVDSVAKVA